MVLQLLAHVRRLGGTYRLSGKDLAFGGATLPPALTDELRLHKAALVEHLQPPDAAVSAQILAKLGVTPIHITDTASAAMAVQVILNAANGGPIGVDIETTPLPERPCSGSKGQPTQTGANAKPGQSAVGPAALSPHLADVRLVQIDPGDGNCYVFDRHYVPWSELAPLWSQHLVAHNAEFELAFLAQRAGIEIEDLVFDCTKQAAGLMLGVHRRSLAAAASAYLGWDMPKGLQTSDWGARNLSDDQIAYAALDAVAARLLWDRLDQDLGTRRDAYNLQRDAIVPSVRMGLRGIGVDVEALAEEHVAWSNELGDARQAFAAAAGCAVPSKPAQVSAWLEGVLTQHELTAWPRTGRGALKTGGEHLERAGHVPAIRPLVRVRELEKLIGSFGSSLREKINPKTGRLHPSFNLAGTKSGRASSSNPNIQQMPNASSAPTFRRVFTAAPGHILVAADYSQMELRAAACISGDDALTEIYRSGQDLHKQVGAEMADVQVQDVTGEQRARAKPVNFGSIYGMGAKGLAAVAWSGYRLEMTETEAGAALDSFFGRFHGLRSWMKLNKKQSQDSGQIKIGCGRVVEAGWEPGGLRYTKCCNLPVQGACADATMRAMARVHQGLRSAGIDGGLVLCIHDELILEVCKEEKGKAMNILRTAMVGAFKETFPSAPVKGLVDATAGKTWADTKS